MKGQNVPVAASVDAGSMVIPTPTQVREFLEKQKEDWLRGWGSNGQIFDGPAANAVACLNWLLSRSELWNQGSRRAKQKAKAVSSRNSKTLLPKNRWRKRRPSR